MEIRDNRHKLSRKQRYVFTTCHLIIRREPWVVEEQATVRLEYKRGVHGIMQNNYVQYIRLSNGAHSLRNMHWYNVLAYMHAYKPNHIYTLNLNRLLVIGFPFSGIHIFTYRKNQCHKVQLLAWNYGKWEQIDVNMELAYCLVLCECSCWCYFIDVST